MIKKVRVEATILQLRARSSIGFSLLELYQITKLKFIRGGGGGEVGLELGEVFFHRGEICATDRTDTF